MPLRHQDSKNHKNVIINMLRLVKLSVLSASRPDSYRELSGVVKKGFSE
jgi:hypothetical protein